MNKNKVISNNYIADFNVIDSTKHKSISIGNYTRDGETLEDILLNLNKYQLSSLFEKIDNEMSYLISEISIFEIDQDKGSKKHVMQLYYDYKLCKSILKVLDKKETIPQIHFCRSTNISDVEKILVEYGLFPMQEKAKKRKTRK